MMSGMDDIIKSPRCFRDEDLRADRQTEFTQLDIQMAFVDQRDVQDLAEKIWFVTLIKNVLDVDLPNPFSSHDLVPMR